MLLAQASGRLIRTATDRGVVAVLDRRLGTARYRWDIVRALPPMRRTRDRAEVEAFLAASDRRAFIWRERLTRGAGPIARAQIRSAGVPDDDNVVRVEVADGVATITLDSPANRNALSTRLVAELGAALDVAEAGVADGAVRAIVLTHVPPAFCAGADLKERRSGPPDSRPIVAVLSRLMDADVPTIAAVKGPARAGGIGLMASCDLVVVAREITFALTEVRIGVARGDHLGADPAPGQRLAAGGRLPHRRAVRRRLRPRRRVGHARGRCRRGRRHRGHAVRRGSGMGAPRAVAETKRLLRLVPGLDRDEAFDRMRALSDELFAGPDAAEGMAAFAEKRPPELGLIRLRRTSGHLGVGASFATSGRSAPRRSAGKDRAQMYAARRVSGWRGSLTRCRLR